MAQILELANPYIILWLILLIVFIAVELFTVGLTSIWFAAGALVALIIAACGGGFVFQLMAFLIVAFGALFATRPWAKKYINSRTQATNADSVIGTEVKVTERVSNIDQTGTVVAKGQEWTARAENDTMIFEQGELAKVVRIDGVKLILTK
ncbi:MAG: NfeD family protein [Agathobacter sp.]